MSRGFNMFNLEGISEDWERDIEKIKNINNKNNKNNKNITEAFFEKEPEKDIKKESELIENIDFDEKISFKQFELKEKEVKPEDFE